MKKLLLSLLVALTSFTGFAQDNNSANADTTAKKERHHRPRRHRGGGVTTAGENKPKVQLYGFVRNYFTYDSHTEQTVNGGLFNTLPYDENLNERGEDLNKQSSAQWMAFTTRLGLNLNGPKLGENCTLSGKIEMDFCGMSGSTYVLRLRQAFARLAWKHNMLTLGQTWHPMFNSDMMPACAALATGSPFQPFNRSPQIRYDVRFGKDNGWRFTYDLLWMLQYTPCGPDKDAIGAGNTANIKFLNNSCIPEMYAGIDHTSKHVLVGVGADFTSLLPRQTRQEIDADLGTVTVKSKDRINAISPMFYLQYKNNKHFKLMSKFVYGQNVAHLNMPSGYGLTKVDAVTGECEYTPLRSISTWVNPVWTNVSKSTNNIIQISLLGGYQKNLGAKDGMMEEYVKYSAIQHKGGKTLDNCFRICPTYSYTIKNFQMAFEYEMTGATYGKEEVNADGLWMGNVDDKQEKNTVINNRACIMVKYNF